jgi:hypothetical protein
MLEHPLGDVSRDAADDHWLPFGKFGNGVLAEIVKPQARQTRRPHDFSPGRAPKLYSFSEFKDGVPGVDVKRDNALSPSVLLRRTVRLRSRKFTSRWRQEPACTSLLKGAVEISQKKKAAATSSRLLPNPICNLDLETRSHSPRNQLTDLCFAKPTQRVFASPSVRLPT